MFSRVAMILVFGPLVLGTSAAAEPLSGQDVWRYMCTVCHTPNGYGSPTGKNLMSEETRALTDDEMRKKIVDGNIAKGMTSFAGLAPEELDGVIAYVRFLQKKASKPRTVPSRIVGDTEEEQRALEVMRTRGEALFAGEARCTSCHSVDTEDSFVGPSLKGIAARRASKEIRDAVLHPSKGIVEGYEAKDVVLPDGTSVRARFREDTEASIELLNMGDGAWVRHEKNSLNTVRDSKRSVMPAIFSRLDDDAQVAILEYLYTLK